MNTMTATVEQPSFTERFFTRALRHTTRRWIVIVAATVIAFHSTWLQLIDEIRAGTTGGYVLIVPPLVAIVAIGITRQRRNELPIHDRQTDIITAVLLLLIALGIPGAKDVESQALGEAWRKIRRSGVPGGVVMLAVPSVAFGLAVVVGPLHMDQLGASPFLIAAAFAAGSIIEVVVGPWVGRVSDRVGRVIPYLIGISTMTAAVIGLGAFGLLPLMFLAVMTLAFGAGLAFTPASTLVTETATDAGVNQGYASGASNMAWGGGQMVGAVGGGVLAGLGGYLLPCLITAALLAGVAMLARTFGTGPPDAANLIEEGAPDGR